MTDTIRDLLISLASHMAYMQGHLEALHELSDPEDYYWYRESVLLRQKVTDALVDGPASVAGQPSDEELNTLWNCSGIADEHGNHTGNIFEFARAVLARWGNRQGSLDSSAPQPPAEGEVAELVARLLDMQTIPTLEERRLAADLLQRLSPPQPVPVHKRLPGPEDCTAEGRCWLCYTDVCNVTQWTLVLRSAILDWPISHWLPAHALPLPGQEVDG